MKQRNAIRRKIMSKNTGPLSAPKKLKSLVTIVDRGKADFYLDILEGFDANLQTVSYGKGTVSTEIMYHLGLSETGKAVI